MERERSGVRTWDERREIVRAYEASGLTQRAFSEQAGIAPSTLRKWCRPLAQEDAGGPDAAVVARLLPVSVQRETPVASSSGVSLVTERGVRIELCAGFDAPTLQRVLSTLGAAA